jgi:phage host-nuclease inhibitor protein Gam
MQTNDEFKDKVKTEINRDIESMGPVDELCARVCTNLAQTIAMLLTNRDMPRLQELERIINELFNEARRAAEAKQNLQ